MAAAWFADTDSKALEVYIQLHRDMTSSQRLARVFELCDFQQSLQIANVRGCTPKPTNERYSYAWQLAVWGGIS
jgi:hypothetical protein